MSAGLGVMLRQMAGNADSVAALTGAIGKTIASVDLKDDGLCLRFTDGSGIRFADEGQSCCEHRYMRTDDELSYYVGAELRGAELRDAPSSTDGTSDAHDVQFLAIQTDRGEFVMSSHNEHNGYYGGFSVEVSALPTVSP